MLVSRVMARHIDQQAENQPPERSGDNRSEPETLDTLDTLAQDDLREQFEVQPEELDVGKITKKS